MTWYEPSKLIEGALPGKRRTERLAVELQMPATGIDNVAVSISYKLTGVELHEAARTLDVHRKYPVATCARIDKKLVQGDALIDGLAIGGDRGVIVIMHDRFNEVALLIYDRRSRWAR